MGKQTDINKGIEKRLKVYNLTKQLILNSDTPIKSKMAIYKTYFKPVLTYASDTLTYSKKELNRIQATEMKFLRGIVHEKEEIMTKSEINWT